MAFRLSSRQARARHVFYRPVPRGSVVRAPRTRCACLPGQPADDRLPITVVTGFLGSGKTTLVNHILRQPHGRKIAIIENEFGEVGIDQDLIASREALDGDEVTILENGCICCTVRDDLVQAVRKLIDRGGFDHILIETTGIANPAPIINTLSVEQSLALSVRMDGVCTVVDARHVGRHLDRKDAEGVENEACAQLAYADRIVLNKRDLVDDTALAALQARVRAINELATMTVATRAEVPVDYVLGIGGYALDAIAQQVEDEIAKATSGASHSHEASHGHEHHGHGHGADEHHGHGADNHEHCDSCGHSHAPGEHDHEHHGHEHAHSHGHEHAHVHMANIHDDAVRSASFVLDGAMDLDKLNMWLNALLQIRGDDIYRMKGILNIKHNRERFVFQGVHQLFEGCPGEPWREGEVRQSKMVFIGRDLDAPLLKAGFEDCLFVEEDGVEQPAADSVVDAAPVSK